MVVPGHDASCPPTPSSSDYDANRAYTDGQKHLAAGEYHLAKEDFQRVLSVGPRQPANVLYLLGRAEAGLHDYRGAANDYEAALRTVPTWIPPARDLAIAQARAGRRDKAVVEFEKLKARLAACNGCAQADDLAAAVKAVQAAIDPAG